MIDLYRGERFKIRTADCNEIDTMFINRRNATPNGNILVICCEGNAGFYEIGITITPIEAGYSVLGWNHPGFGGSTVCIYKLMSGFSKFDEKMAILKIFLVNVNESE